MTEKRTSGTSPKRHGRCHVCGGGSCRHWMNAVTVDLDGAPHIDAAALVSAHGIKPGEGPALTRAHEDPSQPDINLTGMDSRPTVSFQKNGGRVGPMRVKIIPKGVRR